MKRIIPNTNYPLLIVKLTGGQLLSVLENGISKYPALEGRFPMLSGINFSFSSDCKVNERINK